MENEKVHEVASRGLTVGGGGRALVEWWAISTSFLRLSFSPVLEPSLDQDANFLLT